MMSIGSYGFSLIIPTFDRPRQIAGCLESLTRLVPPQSGFEVIVVDDGSPEPLDSIIRPFLGPLRLTLLRQANGGPAKARNAGAAIAKGQFLAFTDDDCRPEAGWLCAIERALEANPTSLVGGVTNNLLRNEVFATASHVIHLMVYAFFNRNPEDSKLLASNNMALSAALFHDLGGFDGVYFGTCASEDRDLCFRCRELGHTMKLIPDAVMGHAHSMSFKAFCRQHFWYGRGAFRYHRKRSRVVARSLRKDSQLHTEMYRWLPEALGSIPLRMRFPVVPLMAVWQVANAAGFVYEWYSCRKWHNSGLPFRPDIGSDVKGTGGP